MNMLQSIIIRIEYNYNEDWCVVYGELVKSTWMVWMTKKYKSHNVYVEGKWNTIYIKSYQRSEKWIMRKEIEQLLKSDLTSNCIATETGVEQSTIHRLRFGERTLDNLGLKQCEKLYDFAIKIKL